MNFIRIGFWLALSDASNAVARFFQTRSRAAKARADRLVTLRTRARCRLLIIDN